MNVMVAPIILAAFQFLALALVFPQLPFQAMALGAEPFAVAVLLATDTVAAVFLAPVLGRLSDRIGRKTVILAGLAVSPVAYLMLANADSLEILFLSRFLGGVGLATISVAQAYLAERTAPNARMAGLAGMNGAYGLAFVFGPLMASALFLGNEAAYAYTAYGAVFCTAASFAVAALSLTAEAPVSPATATRDVRNSAGDGPANGNRVTILLVVSGVVIFAYAAMSATVGVWSHAVLDWGPKELSLAFAVTGGASVLAQILIASRHGRRVNETAVAALAGMTMGAGLILLAWFPHPVGTVAIMAIIGFSTALAFTCVQFLILSHAPAGAVGRIAGLGQSVVGIARIVGPAAGGLCLTYFGMSSPYFLGAILAVAASVALHRVRRSRSGSPFTVLNEGPAS